MFFVQTSKDNMKFTECRIQRPLINQQTPRCLGFRPENVVPVRQNITDPKDKRKYFRISFIEAIISEQSQQR
jgi:hypothetical protein